MDTSSINVSITYAKIKMITTKPNRITLAEENEYALYTFLVIKVVLSWL